MKSFFFKLSLITTAIIVVASCNNEEYDTVVSSNNIDLNNEAVLAGGSSKSAGCHFEYQGELGPENWGTLCGEEWIACNGQAQSPIDIDTSVIVGNGTSERMYLNYAATTTNVLNNGHTVQFNYNSGSTAVLGGTSYELKQFHFHSGSEHTVDGQQYPLEMHLVHQNPDTGLLAVIGLFFEEGEENGYLRGLLYNIPKHEGETYSSNRIYYAENFFPYTGDLGFYRYNGSLTTPGCNEIVTWFVAKQVLQASQEQLGEFKNILHDNYRPVQHLNGREISLNSL